MKRAIAALLLGLLATKAEATSGQSTAKPRGQTYTYSAGHPLGGTLGDPTYLADDAFVVPTYLANPVWKGAAAAGVTVSAIPTGYAGTKNFRVRYATSDSALAAVTCPGAGCVTNCYKARTTIGAAQDTIAPCDVTANDRVDFVLDTLNAGTTYRYTLERQEAGGGWSSQPTYYFTTLTNTAAATQHFLYISDEHMGSEGNSACNTPGTVGYDNFLRFRKTQANVLSRHGTDNYLFYLTTGDNALTHTADGNFDACQTIMGKSLFADNGCANCTESITTQNEADARWLRYLWLVQPVTKYIPLVITLGNHEGETQYAQAVTPLASLGGLTAGHGYWWFDATNSLEAYSRTARLKYFPSPGFTYDNTSGDPDAAATDGLFGRAYSLASGSFELVITDIEGGPADGSRTDGDGTGTDVASAGAGDLDGATPREYPDDFPGACPGDTGNDCTVARPTRGWNDWTYGQTQCTWLTGTTGTTYATYCNGVGGRMAATTWTSGANTVNLTWKIISGHHIANSDTLIADGKFYGRGNMGNTNRTCQAAQDGDPALDGAQCTLPTDCDQTVPIDADSCAAGAGGDAAPFDMTVALAGGTAANMQTAAAAFAAASGNTLFINGHDHLSTCAQKYNPGASGVFYCEGTQPGGDVDDPSWIDNTTVMGSYDWGGKSNQPDGIPDYCSTAAIAALADGGNAQIAACGSGVSTNSIGSSVRGYIDVFINGTTSMVLTQYDTVIYLDTNLLAVPVANNSAEWSMTIP